MQVFNYNVVCGVLDAIKTAIKGEDIYGNMEMKLVLQIEWFWELVYLLDRYYPQKHAKRKVYFSVQ